jgi:Protein of unknown function (DUF3105)
MAAKGKTAPRASKSAPKGSKRRTPPPVVISRPKPWGLIAASVAVVLFAAAVIGYAVIQLQHKASQTPEAKAKAAAKIEGIIVRNYQGAQHTQQPVKYAESPPVGGQHDPEWADCTGTVYSAPLRNENAVHSLEHGAVWITYQPGLSKDEIDSLKERVEGNDRMLMSPYPGLRTKVSLQSWNHQLFVDSVDDKRIGKFINDLRLNPVTTPEPSAQCSNPQFKSAPRTPGPTAAAPSGTAGSSG